jgi:hypothetical protein
LEEVLDLFDVWGGLGRWFVEYFVLLDISFVDSRKLLGSKGQQSMRETLSIRESEFKIDHRLSVASEQDTFSRHEVLKEFSPNLRQIYQYHTNNICLPGYHIFLFSASVKLRKMSRQFILQYIHHRWLLGAKEHLLTL